MTRTHALALAVTLAAASPAFADDITVEPFPFVSTASRAQVQQELRQYRQAGINPWADDHNQLAQFRGSMTRAEVTAEFMAARQSVAALHSEDSGSVYLAKVHAPASSRAIVLAHVR
jgi:hypothetical protein